MTACQRIRAAREERERLEATWGSMLADAVESIAALIAEGPAPYVQADPEDDFVEPHCKNCGMPECWHDEVDGQCPDDDGPHPYSAAGLEEA